MATLADILQETYKVLWEPSDSSNYDEQSVVIPRINDIINQICKWAYKNPSSWQKYTAGDLPFLRRDHFIEIVPPLSTEDEVETTDTTIEFDTTNYLSSGNVFIGNDIITYTGKTATEITGVTGVDIKHNQGEKIYQLYPLPAWISLPFTVYSLDRSGQRNQELPYVDYRYPTQARTYFTIVTKTDWTNLLHIVNCNQTRVMIVYYVNSVAMTTGTDVCVLPDPYALSVIAPLVAGELLRDTEEIDDAIPKLNRGCNNLENMFDYYSKMIKRNRDHIVIQNMDFSSINSFAYGERWQHRGSR